MGITLMRVLFDDASADKFDDADDEHKDEHGDVRDVGHVAVVAVADGEVAEAARASVPIERVFILDNVKDDRPRRRRRPWP